MPRIQMIAPPMAFRDRSADIVSPIMANAMQLADTFVTEIPRIRMQQEAAEQERQRYETDLRMRQDAAARDEARYQTGLKMTQEDRDMRAKAARRGEIQGAGDRLLSAIQPNMTMSGGKIAQAKTPKAGKAPGGFDSAAWSAALKSVEDEIPLYRIDTSGATPTKVELTGSDLTAAIAARRNAMLNRFAGSPEYGAALSGYGVDIDRIGNTLPTTGEPEYADQPGTAMTMGGAASMSPAQLQMALSNFEAVQSYSPEERAALGFSDERLDAIRQYLHQVGGLDETIDPAAMDAALRMGDAPVAQDGQPAPTDLPGGEYVPPDAARPQIPSVQEKAIAAASSAMAPAQAAPRPDTLAKTERTAAAMREKMAELSAQMDAARAKLANALPGTSFEAAAMAEVDQLAATLSELSARHGRLVSLVQEARRGKVPATRTQGPARPFME